MVMQTCLMRISIHTSAREVTAVWVYQVRNGCEFQSTLPQGKWQPIYWEILLILYFNPHFRKGSDSDSNHGDQQVFHFNPHFRKGSDAVILHLHVCPTISIHTSAREVTHFFSFLSYDIYISIHTSAREVTKCSLRCIAPCCISIHTSAREVTDFWFSVSDC